jgi:hypothetical protein
MMYSAASKTKAPESVDCHKWPAPGLRANTSVGPGWPGRAEPEKENFVRKILENMPPGTTSLTRSVG